MGLVSTVLCVLLLAKYLGRISGNKRFNDFLHRIHKPLGALVILTGLVHGIRGFILFPNDFGANLSGLILWIVIIFLALTFHQRKQLKKKWFRYHQVLSAAALILIIIHILLSVH